MAMPCFRAFRYHSITTRRAQFTVAGLPHSSILLWAALYKAHCPPARTYATVELSTHIVRPASHRTGPLRASARVIHDGSLLITAETRVEDESGRLYAHATAICMPLDRPLSVSKEPHGTE